MTLFRILLAATAVAASATSAPALAEKSRDADKVFKERSEGRTMPLPMLEQRVLPRMGGADYLGPELNGRVTRMKFIQGGRVIWVDVDGQGRIVRRSRDK